MNGMTRRLDKLEDQTGGGTPIVVVDVAGGEDEETAFNKAGIPRGQGAIIVRIVE